MKFDEMQMESFLTISGIISKNILAIVFLFAGYAKLWNLSDFAAVLGRLGLVWFRTPIAAIFSATELGLGALFLLGWMPGIAIVIAAALLLVFCITAVFVLWRGESIQCSCFGQQEAGLGLSTIVRSVALAMLVVLSASSDLVSLSVMQIGQLWLISLCLVFFYLSASRLVSIVIEQRK